jgi:hypothetical protein
VSAIVTSDEDRNWFTNSLTWLTILEAAMESVEADKREEYEWYADSLGIDFTLIPPLKRVELARWLLPTIERFCGEEGVRHGWASDRDRAHLQDLADMLRHMAYPA